MRLLAFIGLSLVVASFAVAGSEAVPAAAPPRDPPPTLEKLKEPPPAWVETSRGSRWLGYSSFCWGTTCADFVPPRCGDERHTPTLRLRRGEGVRFHLGFSPSDVGLRGPDRRQHRFGTTRTPEWRFTNVGTFSLFARSKSRGDASYVACVRFA